MASAEQPFDEREQRHLLAEVLKVSSVYIFDVLHFIQGKGIAPNWDDMILPHGRSVSACKRAYDLLTNASAGLSIPLAPTVRFGQPSPTTKSKKKRPAPGGGPSTPADRTIQAQSFTTVNAPGDPVAYQAVSAPPQTPGEPPQKKRGRPNKEEHERRVREAAQRGEVYPPPKKTKIPRQSLEGGSGALPIPGTTEEASTVKEKAKKSKEASATGHVAPEIPARVSSLEATASAADQMQIEMEEAAKSVLPDTQASDFPARESLLAGMREHAAMTTQAGPDTLQSSSTLKQDSAPRSEWEMHSANDPPTTTQ